MDTKIKRAFLNTYEKRKLILVSIHSLLLTNTLIAFGDQCVSVNDEGEENEFTYNKYYGWTRKLKGHF